MKWLIFLPLLATGAALPEPDPVAVDHSTAEAAAPTERVQQPRDNRLPLLPAPDLPTAPRADEPPSRGDTDCEWIAPANGIPATVGPHRLGDLPDGTAYLAVFRRDANGCVVPVRADGRDDRTRAD